MHWDNTRSPLLPLQSDTRTWHLPHPLANYTYCGASQSSKTSLQHCESILPIGLLETISKPFCTLVAADISFLTETHELLPPMQFSSRPSRCTTDTMHLMMSKVKDAWQAGNAASTLFLNIQATFPNTVKSRPQVSMYTYSICLHDQLHALQP